MSRVQVLWTVDCVVVLIVVAIEVVEIVLVLVEVVVMVSPGWKDSYGNGARWQSPSWEEDSLAAGTTGTCRLLTAATGGSWEGTGGLQVATTRHTRRWGGGSYCAVSVGGYCVHGAISRSGIIRIGCFIFYTGLSVASSAEVATSSSPTLLSAASSSGLSAPSSGLLDS